MTVGRAISPREWQNGAAALAISSRRLTGWLGSRMIRSMYASGSSPVAAASCRTWSFARLAAPLGRPAPGRFPPCSFIAIRVIEKPRAVRFGIRFTRTTIRYRGQRGNVSAARLIVPFAGFFELGGLAPHEIPVDIDDRLDEKAALIPRKILILRKLARIREAAGRSAPLSRRNKVGRA
jgi:hypothetical protein